MKRLFIVLLIVGCFFSYASAAEDIFDVKPSPNLLNERWKANWINSASASQYDYGVFHFRKSVVLAANPSSFVINISADNRYRLFVNGKAVCWGPARGDISHWYYETVDIASFMKEGKNTLAVVVWNFSPYTPGAQMTLNTGLIIQGNTTAEEIVNTDKTWKVYQNKAYSPSLDYLQDVGAAEVVDASLYPWGWEAVDYPDGDWGDVKLAGRGMPYGTGTGYSSRVLLPRDIPMMEEATVRMQQIRRAEGLSVDASFLQGISPLVVPANKKIVVLIDQTYLTNAYPELTVSGGKGSLVKLTYNEALYKDGDKGNRDATDGYTIRGFVDKFYPDGGTDRLFRPLWFRTYRYVQMEIETKDEPLTIKDIHGVYTAYPFKENGSFACEDASYAKIWEVGWRTARLCAHETYFDCPYYEQLQYVGDTRIQALISLYVDGDDRLMRKAIKMYDWSRSYEGITTSRYPSGVPQYIPPFSMYWINMVHDYWMYRDDSAFVQSCIPGIKTILEWYVDKIDQQTGILGPVPHWNFVDWPKEWPWSNEKPSGGVPPGGITGGSSILTLQLAYTLRDAVELLSRFEEKDLADRYAKVYESLCQSTMQQCWDEEKQLMKDDPAGTSYSQHANIMGILSDAVPAGKQQTLFTKLDTEPSLIQATFYYRFYLFRALKKVGLANRYTEMLQPWKDMLSIGLTTFAERPEPSRSDCHAWSSSPVLDFLATICGVEPAEPGFRSVRIAPNPGVLKQIKGIIPHPKGLLEVSLKRTGDALSGEIILPPQLAGTYHWQGKEINLLPGHNRID